MPVSPLQRVSSPIANPPPVELSDYPWNTIPDGHIPFDPAALIVTPATIGAGGAMTEILQIPIPAGYDMVIKGLAHQCTGGGFVDGSGDLIWTLKLDQQPIRNYASLAVQFGTLGNLRPVNSIRGRANQVFRYFVTNVGFGGGVGVTQILASVSGYFYPNNWKLKK